MKLVSLLCLILGTACISEAPLAPQTRSDDAIVEPNAPDLESIDPPTIEPNAPDFTIPPRLNIPGHPDLQLPTRSCVSDDDCAADETCTDRRCRLRFEPGQEPF